MSLPTQSVIITTTEPTQVSTASTSNENVATASSSETTETQNNLQGNDSDSDGEPTPKKKRTEYEYVQNFDSKDLALDHLNKIGEFSYERKYTLAGGEVRENYRCSMVTKRSKQCPVKLYLVLHADSPLVNLYMSKCKEHVHETLSNAKVTNEIKEKIENLVKIKVKNPKHIADFLYKETNKKFTVEQVKNVLKSLDYLSPILNYGTLVEVVNSLKTVPDVPNEPYVINSAINPDEKKVKILISSRRLLSNVKQFDFIQIDGTFKLSWNGFPVLVLGELFL